MPHGSAMTTLSEPLVGAGALTSAPVARVDAEFRRGAVAMLPLLAGVAPFACLVGVAISASAHPAAAWTGVWLVFAGTAQLTAVQLVGSGAGVLAAAATALVVNARLAVLSLTLAPHWRGTRLSSRLVAAATVVDPTWFVAMPRFAEGGDPAAGRRYYYGASLALWIGWPAMVTMAMLAGTAVPPEAGLELLAPVSLMAMVARPARTRRGIVTVAAAATAALASSSLPSSLALLTAVAAGVLAAAGERLVSTARSAS